MSDLREYSFGNWLGICMKLIPAMLIAQLIWTLVFFGPFALLWLLIQF